MRLEARRLEGELELSQRQLSELQRQYDDVLDRLTQQGEALLHALGTAEGGGEESAVSQVGEGSRHSRGSQGSTVVRGWLQAGSEAGCCRLLCHAPGRWAWFSAHSMCRAGSHLHTHNPRLLTTALVVPASLADASRRRVGAARVASQAGGPGRAAGGVGAAHGGAPGRLPGAAPGGQVGAHALSQRRDSSRGGGQGG